jgi:hypothetical protein
MALDDKVKRESAIKLIYKFDLPEQVEKHWSFKMFKHISRLGGAVAAFLAADALMHADPNAPIGAYVAVSYILTHGLADLITGRHHYLPVRGFMLASDGIYSLLRGRNEQYNT